jgi:Ni/Co efflux regulator RcnB
MTKLLSVVIAAMFAAVSLSAIAADAPGDTKMEKKDKMEKKAKTEKKAKAKKGMSKDKMDKMDKNDAAKK